MFNHRCCCGYRRVHFCDGSLLVLAGSGAPEVVYVSANVADALQHFTKSGDNAGCYYADSTITNSPSSTALKWEAADVTVGDCCEEHCNTCDKLDFDATPDYYDLTISGTQVPISAPHCFNLSLGGGIPLGSFQLIKSGSSIDGVYRVPLEAAAGIPTNYSTCRWVLFVDDGSWEFRWCAGQHFCLCPDATFTGFTIVIERKIIALGQIGYQLNIRAGQTGGLFGQFVSPGNTIYPATCSETLDFGAPKCTSGSQVCLIKNNVGSMIAVPEP